MKVLHIITSLRTGGAEKLIVDLLPRLSEFGNDVDLLIFNGEKTEFYHKLEGAGIKIYDFGESIYSPLHIFRLIKFMHRYDIIHTHNTPCQYAAAIAHCLSFGGCKLITTEHMTDNRRRNHKLFYLFDKFIYSKYKKIICVSDQTKINLENYNGKSAKITTIYNGIDLSAYHKSENFSDTDNNHIIIMIAGFRPQKDQDTLLKAMTLLPKDYRLQLAGDGVRRAELEKLAADLNITDRVDFLGVRNDIPDLLNKASIVVLSSHSEGLSLSSLEGMASGHPFIASDVDGLHEIVKDNGILFPEGDYNKLAEEIKKLTEDKEYAKQIAINCQNKAKQYDISLTALEYNNIYKELIE